MSNSQSLDLWSLPETKPSIFNRLGYSLGTAFVSVKKKATSKYLDVTRGINERIDAENEVLRQEMDMLLTEQEMEHQSELTRYKRRWIFFSLMFAVITFFGGAATVFFNLVV
ncbi:hypothetical protein QJU87_04155 [Pasteurella skyensis]|uniref:hypothetical protein n=1 Tax=Phocoenobacter skyensis TaxID=97481 RepID=UPI00275DACC3|nr:hypothetical protein [Pasteurella skyensis]MDP8189057.1 hypothetical protein [Pasteurella skyensis]